MGSLGKMPAWFRQSGGIGEIQGRYKGGTREIQGIIPLPAPEFQATRTPLVAAVVGGLELVTRYIGLGRCRIRPSPFPDRGTHSPSPNPLPKGEGARPFAGNVEEPQLVLARPTFLPLLREEGWLKIYLFGAGSRSMPE